MTGRHALLIGVPICDVDSLPDLTNVVAEDISRMHRVLAQSDYQVQVCGGDNPKEPTGSRIKAALKRACRSAPRDGVLVVYFTGHGYAMESQSYVVPCDGYERADDEPDPESLVKLVDKYLENSPARLTVLFVDACRTTPAGQAPLPSGGTVPYPANGAFVLVNGCSPGQVGRSSDTGSFFTQALAEALDRRSPARTLGDVLAEVERGLQRKAVRTSTTAQKPDVGSAHHGLDSDTSAIVICEGDEVGEAWRRAVSDAALWKRCEDEPAAQRIKEALLPVVGKCAAHWAAAKDRLDDEGQIEDAWSDQDYPTRLLRAIDTCLGPNVTLTPCEAGMLVAAPSIYECAQADGLREAAGLRPADFSRTYGDGARSDLELTHAMYEHVCRRAEGLEKRGEIESRDALAMWLVHQWLGSRPRVRENVSARQMCELIAAPLAADHSARSTEKELRILLAGLADCAGFEAGGLIINALADRSYDSRVRALAVTLWLASVMAVDPRRLPAVVVDHVGIGAGFQLSALPQALAQMSWQRDDGRALQLHAICDHPALHRAFELVVQQARSARRDAARLPMDGSLASELPTGFGEAGLRAELEDDRPSYEVPLQRFRLSDDKVRELLIGQQMYEDPALAIRELYQNALDACRYRDVRRQYLLRTCCEVSDWQGRITFSQGLDDNGREYIECADNGVGMSKETLEKTFASAGERFVYSQKFRGEQARWQTLSPPLRLIPNSQFGIGVFSYFMIADEIEIMTRATSDRDVVDGQAHSVRIASSGSLFRVTTGAGLPSGGTRVRLYLTGENRISVLQTLRSLLLVAEYRVEVEELDTGNETWEPDQLHFPGSSVEPLRHGDDLWWVTGEGCFAADGIRTNEKIDGLVVNLRDKRRPTFTVNRNKLKEWDRDWVQRQVRDSLPELASWPGLTIAWLWSLAQSRSTIAQLIYEYLSDRGQELPVGGLRGGSWARVDRVGCLPLDHDVFEDDRWWQIRPDDIWLIGWRTAVWQSAGQHWGNDRLTRIKNVEGLPVVEPQHSELLDAVCKQNNYLQTRFGRPAVDVLSAAGGATDETPVTRLRRLRRYAITGMDLRHLRDVPPIDRTFKEEEQPVLAAVGAWALPGSSNLRPVGGWLAKASSELHIPLVEVIRRVREIVPPDWNAPEQDLSELHAHVFNQAELCLFSRRVNGQAPWIGSVVSPAHVMRCSASLGRPVSDILGLFDQFAVLGYSVEARDRYPGDLTAIEAAALRCLEHAGDDIEPVHILTIANRLDTSLLETLNALHRLQNLGFAKLSINCELPDDLLTAAERRVINAYLFDYDYVNNRFVPRLGWRSLLYTIWFIGKPGSPGYNERLPAARRLLDVLRPRGPLPAPRLVELAQYLRITTRETASYYKELFPDSAAEFSWDSVPANLEPDHRDVVALIGQPPWFEHFDLESARWRLRPADIVRAVPGENMSIGALLERLEPYRALGAPVPELDEETQQKMQQVVPDHNDRWMLSTVDDEGRERFVDRIDALRLVQVAGRFGWKVTEAHERMARLVPIGLQLDYPVDACPDEIVHWRDLLVITEYLDGQEPVLSGTVTSAHVAWAVEELEEPAEAIVKRLETYAELIGYTVDQEGMM